MERKDGGPAFPRPASEDRFNEENYPPSMGMSLRAYLIAHAPAQEIEHLCPNRVADCAKFLGMNEGEYIGAKHWVLVLAKARGIWADAMLAERGE